MFGSLAKRRRGPLWGWLAFLSLGVVVASLFVAAEAKSAAIHEASTDAKLLAQTELATLLEPSDLRNPVLGERAMELGTGIEAKITSVSGVDEVRIYSALGRILFADDPAIVGTHPSYLRDLMFEVAGGEAQTQLRSGMLQTLVPIWLSPGGTVVVAEMSQPLGPITSRATTVWFMAALGGGFLFLAAVVLVFLSSRSRPTPMPVRVFPAASARVAAGPVAARPPMQTAPARPRNEPVLQPNAPTYQMVGFRGIEQKPRAVDSRAEAAEKNLQAMQKQLKQALEQNSMLEGRLAAAVSTSSTSDSEVAALREQLGQTTERLTVAELDAKALRERLTLRKQELEEVQSQLRSARAGADQLEDLKRRLQTAEDRDEELEDLRKRLESAEDRADKMAQEMERMEAELDYTASQFHMTKLSEALREIEREANGGQTTDDLRAMTPRRATHGGRSPRP